MGSSHTPGTLRAIPSGFLKRLVKLTSLKPYFCSERVDSVYPDHVSALCKAGLSPPIFLERGELWKGQYEKTDIENEK